jgi:ubiquinone/menaquinone biosynthesis C-methylase UbiE
MQTVESRTPAMTPPDPDKLDRFVGRMLGDVGAMMTGALVAMGDRLGLYRVLAEAGPSTPAELAKRAGVNERYLREWLSAQAASGYVTYDPETGAFALDPEQAAVFVDEDSPAYMMGAFDIATAVWNDEPRVRDAFRSGRGVGWHERHPCLFCGTERFFRPSYHHHLVPEWLPALRGVIEKLKAGARVADVGCGHGASTLIMAKAFPASTFTGFDYHGGSVEAATDMARNAGLDGRVRFEKASAKDFPGENYDLVCFFDCLHDMGDPVGAARHVRAVLAPDGTWLVVEPFAKDELVENLNPVGRVYYAASTMICTPASLSQEVGAALGAQAGPERLLSVIREAGFSEARVALETPFNLVIEAKPH